MLDPWKRGAPALWRLSGFTTKRETCMQIILESKGQKDGIIGQSFAGWADQFIVADPWVSHCLPKDWDWWPTAWRTVDQLPVGWWGPWETPLFEVGRCAAQVADWQKSWHFRLGRGSSQAARHHLLAQNSFQVWKRDMHTSCFFSWRWMDSWTSVYQKPSIQH